MFSFSKQKFARFAFLQEIVQGLDEGYSALGNTTPD